MLKICPCCKYVSNLYQTMTFTSLLRINTYLANICICPHFSQQRKCNANLELQIYHIFAPFANISKSVFSSSVTSRQLSVVSRQFKLHCFFSAYLKFLLETHWAISWLNEQHKYHQQLSKPAGVSTHRRTGNFLPGAGKPFAHKILASCPNVYKTVEKTRAIRCNNIGRISIWKRFDTVFQGQYLPSLSINYVATNRHLEKLPPLPIILGAIFLTGSCSYKIVQGSFFLQ